ncbi:MAG: acyl carrier protein [Pirellulales bacterium]|nr:acyl carrier protein [Pirellulales bacterium]
MSVDKQSLLSFFESELALDTSDIDGKTPLFSTGVVDSFAMVSLITFVEKEGGFRMNPIDVNLDNLDSIDRIINYIERAKN